MRHYNILLLTLFISFTFLSGCKKYEDGPKFTLRTVKNRLTNGSWKLENLTRSGTDVTSSYKEIDFSYSFDVSNGFKDNTYSQSLTYYGQLNKLSGAFDFLEDDKIQFTLYSSSNYGYYPPVFSYDNNYNYPVWTVTKLSNKDFWLETTVEGQDWSMKLTKDK